MNKCNKIENQNDVSFLINNNKHNLREIKKKEKFKPLKKFNLEQKKLKINLQQYA